MTEKGYMSDMYKQLQEIMQKCDSLSHEVKTIKRDTEKKYKAEIKKIKEEHKKEVNSLKSEIKTLREENKKLNNEVDRLKSQINKDSDNSSSPPSSDIKPNRKIPNNRKSTNNKVGGQTGHKGYYLSKKEVVEKIRNNVFEHKIIDIGKKSDKYISKYILDIKVNVIAKEYRFYQDENGKYNIPKEFKVDVQYGPEIKTLCSTLNTEGIVAINKLTDFVSSISHGKLKISNGSIVNFIKELAVKSKSIMKNFEEEILNALLIHTDATTTRCDNKNMCVRNYSTDKYTLLKATNGKSKKYIDESGILPKYVGALSHDHETLMYNYGKKHAECNVHILRYLTGNYDNTSNNWCKDLSSFLCSLNEYKKELLSKNITSISMQNLEKYSLRYDEIIKKGFEENKKITSKYYAKEERKLLNRLKKYKENHLIFIYDFSMPFDNNLSERELRHVKCKQKISGFFKSKEGLQSYLDIKSLIITCKKQCLDYYTIISNIYQNIPVEL